MDIRKLNDAISVSPQLSVEDVKAAAEAGFKTIINNRPDGEMLGQPTSADIEAAAKACGLDYYHIPVAGSFPAGAVQAYGDALETSGQPVLAFCRSGTRSSHLWALSSAGKLDADTIIEAGRAAGYDLSMHRAFLEAESKKNS